MDSTWSGRSEEDIQCYLVDETSTPCASIEARTLKIRDRRAFSRIAFQPGQVLFRNSPYTLVPHRSKDFCSACFGPAPQKRCSQCLKAWYCSKACQVKDFPLHRIECREHLLLWSHLEMDDIEWQRNARLILRTYLRLQTMCQKTSHCQRINSGAGYYSCSGQHFQQLEATKKPLDTVELASIHVVKQVLRQKKIRSLLKKYYNISETASNDHQLGVDVENILRRFSVNNFGVVDDMMSVTGSGVYPLAALLNHSCAPNCFHYSWWSLRRLWDTAMDSTSAFHQPRIRQPHGTNAERQDFMTSTGLNSHPWRADQNQETLLHFILDEQSKMMSRMILMGLLLPFQLVWWLMEVSGLDGNAKFGICCHLREDTSGEKLSYARKLWISLSCVWHNDIQNPMFGAQIIALTEVVILWIA